MKIRRARQGGWTDGVRNVGSPVSICSLLRPAACAVRVEAVAAILLALCFWAGAAFGASEPFSTPESAITFFIDCVKAENYDCALRACAVEQIADGFDYEGLIKWLRVMSPSSQYLPSEYGLFAAHNRHAVEYFILHQLSWMTLSMVLPPEYESYLSMRMLVDSTINFDRVVADMNPQRIQRLEIAEIGRSHLLDNERHEQYLEQQAEVYGAQAATSRAVLYELDGSLFVGGFQLLQYDGNWLIAALHDILISQPGTGTLIKVSSPSEFEALLHE